jgi:hypothetical protein
MRLRLFFSVLLVLVGVVKSQPQRAMNVENASIRSQHVKRIIYSAGGQMTFNYSSGGILPEVTYVFGRDTSVWKVTSNPLSLRTISGHALVDFDSIQCNAEGYVKEMLMLNAQSKKSKVYCDYDTDGRLLKFVCMYNSRHGIVTQLYWHFGNLIKSVYYENNNDSLKEVGSMDFIYDVNAPKNDCGLYYPNQYLDIELFNPLLYSGLMGKSPSRIPTSYVTNIGKNSTRSRISVWHDKLGRIERINENSYEGGFNTKETISFTYE